ncbi:MAG: sulfatase [Planctomyces sp.]|nr:sulfatase [Planctomyces sp.]
MRNFNDTTAWDFAGCSRRSFLSRVGGGFGSLAAADLLLREATANEVPQRPELNGGLHHPAKVRRVIQLFMNGGVSQMDTFDYKPELHKRHGEKQDFGIKTAVTSDPGALMKSPFEFQQHGDCGRWVSSVFPQMAKHVDDLAFLMAMKSQTNVHGPASYLQNTGFLNPGFPSMGAWLSYGLGRLTDNLPTFVVLPDHRGLPYNNSGNFSAGFLPASHAATIIKPESQQPIPNLFPPEDASAITATSEKAGLELIDQLNRRHQESRASDLRLQARMESFELAARMQLSAPEALDLKQETAATLERYGIKEEATAPFARNCLLARRLIERNVRFVQVWSGAGGASNNWDNHNDIPNELATIARSVDQPISALLSDLKERGLLEDTLVIWTTEFGRMPFTQGATGRDHNGGTFVSWLAGAGIKGGTSFGQSDDFAYEAATDITTGYDLHATVLHLMGIDHEQLTFRHNGLDRRLTDVHGHVIKDVLS